MKVDPSILIIAIIVVLIVIYIDTKYMYKVEHNTNIDEYIENKENDSEENIIKGSDAYIKNIDTDRPLDTSIQIDLNAPPQPHVDPNKLQIITAGLGPEVRRLGHLESELSDVRLRQIMNTNILEKLYKRDVLGDYMTRGWFVQVYDVNSTSHGVTLGAEIDRFSGIKRICFRSHNNFPFLGIPQDPIYLPKSDFVGFRAMTVFKVPKTGYYDFKVLSDDGSRLMYQVVDSDVMLDEKNIRSTWSLLIDQWRFQAETWNHSEKIYFNQSDMVLLRFDYFQADANSSACVKVRYSETYKSMPNDNFDDFNIGNLYCSLLWSEVPLMGVR